MKAKRLVQQGQWVILAFAVDIKVKEITMDRVPIVKKISDVFLEDLPTVPPTWAVDFRIKIELGATDISKVTYCLAQAELKKTL